MPLTLILGGEYIYYDKNLGMMVAGDNSNSELIEQSDWMIVNKVDTKRVDT
ncbi:hypothetical protein [Enterococcus faecalis]|uniref:hypothetical protein n=1 Tax=Enterococcus faecalis TaxID=1351 RepID=UPI00189AE358|nr:hypothetical protein [Enterococcus faecalis]